MEEIKTIGEKKVADRWNVPLICEYCGHKFVSNSEDWPRESDNEEDFRVFSPPNQYPPDCPNCGYGETIPDMTEAEWNAMWN